MIYTTGLLVILAARVTYAGAKQRELFYSPPSEYDITYRKKKKEDLELDGDKIFKFIVLSIPFALLWPISLPAIGLFKLGQQYAKTSRS